MHLWPRIIYVHQNWCLEFNARRKFNLIRKKMFFTLKSLTRLISTCKRKILQTTLSVRKMRKNHVWNLKLNFCFIFKRQSDPTNQIYEEVNKVRKQNSPCRAAVPCSKRFPSRSPLRTRSRCRSRRSRCTRNSMVLWLQWSSCCSPKRSWAFDFRRSWSSRSSAVVRVAPRTIHLRMQPNSVSTRTD